MTHENYRNDITVHIYFETHLDRFLVIRPFVQTIHTLDRQIKLLIIHVKILCFPNLTI